MSLVIQPQEEEPPEPPDETLETLEEATAEILGEEEKRGDQGQEDKGQGVQKSQGPPQGQVKRLTDYFNQIGGPKTPKAPKIPQKAPRTPKTPGRRTLISTPGSGGVSKTSRKGKPKIDESERSKLELAMKAFL